MKWYDDTDNCCAVAFGFVVIAMIIFLVGFFLYV